MRCPTLTEVPPPPGKTGWPWTEESPHLPKTMPDGSPWPRVSIVTPSYNQGQFVEETIRSVLLQGYPNLEYIIIDGGSTDGSVDIIRKYEPLLAYWVSEPDNGQAYAINAGWSVARGDALTWLNSDDTLLPRAIARAVATLFTDPSIDLVYGNVYHVDPFSNRIGLRLGEPFSLEYVLTHWHNVIPQPGFLMQRAVIDKAGLLDETMRFAMDFDYWLRLAARGGCLVYLPEFLANARVHPEAKTSGMQSVAAEEQIRICKGLLSYPHLAHSLRVVEKQIYGAAYLSAAYWSYLSNNARVTRQYASLALQYPVRRRDLALSLWLVSVFGNHGMASIRAAWRNIGQRPSRL